MIVSNLSTCYSGVCMTNQASNEQASTGKKSVNKRQFQVSYKVLFIISNESQCFVSKLHFQLSMVKESGVLFYLHFSLKTHGTNVYLQGNRKIATHPKKAEFSRSSKALAK